MRVVLTRPQAESARWARLLRSRGFDVLQLPLIDIAAASDRAPLARAWGELDRFNAAMFVSGNAVHHFFDARPAAAIWPAGTRAWATGAGTRQALLDAGVADPSIDTPSVQAPQFDSEALWEQVNGQAAPGSRVLLVRGSDSEGQAAGRDWLAERLAEAGADVQTVVAYRRSVPNWSAHQVEQARQSADSQAVWLFGSSQGIRHLLALVPGQDWSDARALATHPRIAQSARQAGFGVVCESRPAEHEVSAALESFR